MPVTENLVTPSRLAGFFAPRSLAVVGASDTSGWARFLLASSVAAGFDGPLVPVHPVHKTVFGRPAVPSLRDLPEPVDLAFIMAPLEAVEDVLDDAGAAGVRGVVVLASGYREVGDDGQALQDRLVARAARHGITVLGPNCLGFLNAHAKVAPFALTIPLPLLAGPVGIALQSGALASVLLSFAKAHAIGVSTLASLGNEAMISTSDVIDYLVEDERTKVIALFLEQVGDPAAFAAAAARADDKGKPIVALKVGSSQAGSAAALAHTGSVAGDDAVVDAALRQLNVVRVTSIEELLTTAAVLGYSRWPAGRRMGAVTTSGGACDLIADRAAGLGIDLPSFSPPVAAAIEPLLPPFAEVRNPLDVTGYFLANRRAAALTPVDAALDQAVADPALDFVLYSGLTLPDGKPADEAAAGVLEERAAWLGNRIATAPIPVIPITSTCVDLSDYARSLLGRHGVHVLGGIDLGVLAVSNALRWTEGRGRATARAATAAQRQSRTPAPRPPGSTRPETARSEATPPAPRPPDGTWPEVARSEATPPAPQPPDGTWPEVAARSWLIGHEIPLVPLELVTSADEAVRAAGELGFPVAVKISSAAIAHKSELGAVALGLRDEAEVAAAYKRVLAAAGDTPVDGVTVSAMRSGGIELLAGVTVDPIFGPVLAVGLGGIWVEVLRDVSLRVLPTDRSEVLAMLGELRGIELLRGARGQAAADLGQLASVIAAAGEAALSLGSELRSLEINPLWVNGDQIEALDVLVITAVRAENGELLT